MCTKQVGELQMLFLLGRRQEKNVMGPIKGFKKDKKKMRTAVVTGSLPF